MSNETTLPPLPETMYDLHYEWPDDEDGYGGSEVIGENGYTANQMRAYAREALAQQWQPIETAPTDGTAILLGSRGGAWIGKWLPVYTSGYRPDNPWSSLMLNHDHMGEKFCRPSHWMPLPAAPAP